MKHTLKFYNSFQEQAQEEAKYAASLSPTECVKQAVALIKKMYPEIDNKKSNRINFIKIA